MADEHSEIPDGVLDAIKKFATYTNFTSSIGAAIPAIQDAIDLSPGAKVTIKRDMRQYCELPIREPDYGIVVQKIDPIISPKVPAMVDHLSVFAKFDVVIATLNKNQKVELNLVDSYLLRNPLSANIEIIPELHDYKAPLANPAFSVGDTVTSDLFPESSGARIVHIFEPRFNHHELRNIAFMYDCILQIKLKTDEYAYIPAFTGTLIFKENVG